MKFIRSNGGPLILIERRLVPFWGGIDNIGGVSPQIPARLEQIHVSDYERACAISGWIDTVPVADGQGVVFSGDRIDLGVFKINSNCVLIVRPFNEIENIERSMNLALSAKYGFQKVSSFRSTDNEHMIFDSAFPGTEIRRDFIEFSLSVGRHDISTYEDRSCGREMVFHRFDLIADN